MFSKYLSFPSLPVCLLFVLRVFQNWLGQFVSIVGKQVAVKKKFFMFLSIYFWKLQLKKNSKSASSGLLINKNIN